MARRRKKRSTRSKNRQIESIELMLTSLVCQSQAGQLKKYEPATGHVLEFLICSYIELKAERRWV